MWVFLWIVLSSVLIVATLWSLKILLAQKKAWEAYAKARNISFLRGTFMGPPEMGGMVGDYKLSFFTAQRPSDDIRERRYMTVVEIDLSEGLIDGVALGTLAMLPFLQTLDKLHPYKIETDGWGEEHFVFVHDDEAVKNFLTPARIEALGNILKTRNADVLVVFNERQMVVRLETVDPMQDAEKIDKIVKRLIALCEKVRGRKGEDVK